MKSILYSFYLIVGIMGPIAFMINQELYVKVYSTGLFPNPMVFDAPEGHEFWSSSYKFRAYTSEGDKEYVFGRSMWSQTSSALPVNMVLLTSISFAVLYQDKNESILKIVERAVCNRKITDYLNLISFEKTESKLNKVIFYIKKTKEEKERLYEISCN